MWTECIEPSLGVPEVLLLASRATLEGRSAGTTNRVSEVRPQDFGKGKCVPALWGRFSEEDLQPAPGRGAYRRDHDRVRDFQTGAG